jgi:hypothetical protein
MRGLDVDGALETTCSSRRPERDQVTIRVTVCDQGPTLLSFPMILQRMEYSFPDWKPGMSIFVQSPQLAL